MGADLKAFCLSYSCIYLCSSVAEILTNLFLRTRLRWPRAWPAAVRSVSSVWHRAFESRPVAGGNAGRGGCPDRRRGGRGEEGAGTGGGFFSTRGGGAHTA